MLKNSYFTFLLVCLAHFAIAQSPTLTINDAALSTGSVTVDASGYNYNSGLLSLFPSIAVRSGSANLSSAPAGPTIPVSRFTAAVVRGSTVGGAVTLSTTDQAVTGSFLGLLNFGSGAFLVRYSAPSLSSYAWQAGNYSVPLHYTLSGINVLASVTPTDVTLNVVVPAFITSLNEPGDIEFLINNLNYFRTTPLTVTKTISNRHTVPLTISLTGNNSLFTFSNGHTGVQAPTTNINRVTAKMTAPVAGTQITLSNASQVLSTGTIPAGNSTTNTAEFSISSANMLAGFINKGTYTNALNMQVKDANGVYTSLTYNKTLNLRVIVSDLAELNVNTSTINLHFLTGENYRAGVSTEVSNHLVVSRTTPYDITVKAAGENFTFGVNTIPVSVLSIGPASGQTGVNTISSLTTQPQMLVSAAAPTVDRNISLKYSIPSTQTQNLLNKQAGIYTTNVIYTLTAH